MVEGKTLEKRISEISKAIGRSTITAAEAAKNLQRYLDNWPFSVENYRKNMERIRLELEKEKEK